MPNIDIAVPGNWAGYLPGILSIFYFELSCVLRCACVCVRVCVCVCVVPCERNMSNIKKKNSVKNLHVTLRNLI